MCEIETPAQSMAIFPLRHDGLQRMLRPSWQTKTDIQVRKGPFSFRDADIPKL